MEFHLQEAYKTPTGEMTFPHWDEWSEFDYQSLVPDEEVIDGVVNLGVWYEVAHNEEMDIGDTVWWNDPDNGVCSQALKVVELKDDDNVIVSDNTTVLASECETMPIYRRIAEVDDKELVSKLDLAQLNSVDYKGVAWHSVCISGEEIAVVKDIDLATELMNKVSLKARIKIVEELMEKNKTLH